MHSPVVQFVTAINRPALHDSVSPATTGQTDNCYRRYARARGAARVRGAARAVRVSRRDGICAVDGTCSYSAEPPHATHPAEMAVTVARRVSRRVIGPTGSSAGGRLTRSWCDRYRHRM